MEIGIIIDTLTNSLVCTETGEKCDTEYHLVSKTITQKDALELKARGWKFDRNTLYIDTYGAIALINKYFKEDYNDYS